MRSLNVPRSTRAARDGSTSVQPVQDARPFDRVNVHCPARRTAESLANRSLDGGQRHRSPPAVQRSRPSLTAEQWSLQVQPGENPARDRPTRAANRRRTCRVAARRPAQRAAGARARSPTRPERPAVTCPCRHPGVSHGAPLCSCRRPTRLRPPAKETPERPRRRPPSAPVPLHGHRPSPALVAGGRQRNQHRPHTSVDQRLP